MIDSDGNLNVESKCGWSANVPDPPLIHINDDFPRSQSLRTMKVLISDIKSDGEKFGKSSAISVIANEYKTAVSIPVTHAVVYGFLFQRDMRVFTEFASYLECVRSILAHWEFENSGQLSSASTASVLVEKALTGRQQAIVEMIKDGRTNGSIALELGYSESLIRQETIQIYRKLGISGRRDLISNA